MKSLYISALLRLFLLAGDTTKNIVLVASYTFDPLNNSWKPSGNRRPVNRSHHSSSSASSYSYAPAEPTPAAGVEFTYNEEDFVRHHYEAWGVGGDGEVNNDDPAFVPKRSLVEIQYNKRTGEVSLHDEEGVVTPEEYKRLKDAVKYSAESDSDFADGMKASEQTLKSQERQEDIAVGSVIYVDPEDLDPTDIIDTVSRDFSDEDHSNDTRGHSQQLQDYPDHSTQYHQSNDASSPISTDAFDSYSISQPESVDHHSTQQATVVSSPVTTETYDSSTSHHLESNGNYPVQHMTKDTYDSSSIHSASNSNYQQQYQHYQYSQQPMPTTSVVDEPTTQQYYQQQTANHYAYDDYYQTTITEQQSPSTGDETMEVGYQDYEAYRSSRGFGFSGRRDTFT